MDVVYAWMPTNLRHKKGKSCEQWDILHASSVSHSSDPIPSVTCFMSHPLWHIVHLSILLSESLCILLSVCSQQDTVNVPRKLARAYPLPALEEPHTPGEELTLRQHSWCLCSLKLVGRTSNRVGRSTESLLWSVFVTETQTTRSTEFTGSYWGHAWEVSVGQCGGLVRECCRGEYEVGSDLGISRKPVMEWF